MHTMPLPPRFARKPLAVAAAIALALAAGFAPQAHAQTGTAAAAATPIAINIPAQPLAQALNELARQANLQMTFPAALVAGKQAPAVSGQMTARQALERMLAGSGLAASVSGSAVVVRAVPAPQAGETTLPVVTVTAGAEQESATGPVQGYVAKRSAAGTKTDTPLVEIPQSITVVGREQIADQGAQSLQETLRYAPSVVADLFGLDTRNDGFAIRGQEATIQFLDGMRRFYGNYVNASRIETHGLERIEILRGPSSLLYGQSGVGGTVNMVSKRPQEAFGGELGLSYGSHDAKVASFDLTGPASADGRWLYRLVGLARDADTQVDFVEEDRLFLAPSLTFRPSADTRFTLLGHWSQDRGGSTVQFLPHEGTLFAGPNGRIPINRFVGEPGIDRYDADSWSLALLADHTFNPTWSIHQRLRHVSSDVTYAQLFPYLPGSFTDPARRLIARDLSASINETETLTSDTHAVARFDLGTTQHKLLLGFDYSRADIRRVRDTGVTDCGMFDLYAPQYGQFTPCDFSLNPLAGIPMERRPDRAQWQKGMYVQDQMRKGSWIAVLGLRKDWTATETQGEAAEKADALTARVGLMYALPSGLSPYVSYAESFVPVAGSDFFDRPFRPIEGRSIEAGVKFQRPGSGFVINSAVFDATEVNRLAEDPLNPGFSVQTGKVRLKGFEIEARGDVTRDIKLIAAYSYLNADYVSGDQAGFRVESLPSKLASLWAVHTSRQGILKGLSVGAGVRYNGASWDGYDTLKTPSFTLFDAMLAYESGGWRWSVNASNLADKYHVTTCLNRGDCFLGAGRQITTKLTYKF
jgi:iron complex outermembrane receptor protein